MIWLILLAVLAFAGAPLFAVIVAVLCIFYQPGKILAVITILLLASTNPLVAVAALVFVIALYFVTRKTKRR